MQPRRLPEGGLIDRNTPIDFSFNGRKFQACAGDSLASALLAQGINPVARSIKYHRPRGILSAGLEEPNALVSCKLPDGATIPNLKATEIPLSNDLVAFSQNCWPSVNHDFGSLLQAGSSLLAAGFYYKTFMWPPRAWHRLYEKVIRRIAGQGRLSNEEDHRQFDRRNAWCDLLIVGSGPAGLAAALAAAGSDKSVLLLEQDRVPGGSTLWEQQPVESDPAAIWRERTLAAIAKARNIEIKCNTLAFGRYDHGRIMALQRDATGVDSISWRIRCKRLLLACGASERPLLFPGNDRPGIMLAASVRQYIHRYAVAPGYRAMLAIADPTELELTRQALLSAGINIAGELKAGEHIVNTTGGARLKAVCCRGGPSGRRRIDCDLLCVSAGWNPNAQLAAQTGERLNFEPRVNALVPPAGSGIAFSVGAGRGPGSISDCVRDGELQAQRALADLNGQPIDPGTPPGLPDVSARPAHHDGPAQVFVDLQNDVTRKDLELALREGYDHVELAKRYTTLGMGTDQGKTSWSNAILEISRITGSDPATTGHTSFRPPCSPVSLGALAGADRGQQMMPVRRTPFHQAFENCGCVFQTSGDWLYSRYFPQARESMPDAIEREVKTVRNRVGCVDMSTLGKVDVRGSDALEFLQRLYCNNLDSIEPGRLRYALMLREDGLLFDDGTVTQLGERHFLVTMTTANSASVWLWMNKLLQAHWPDLDVQLTLVSDHWASLAIAGPEARRLLQALKPDFSCEREEFPFASVREGLLDHNLPCRVFSLSFSGELSYEINVPARYARDLFERVMDKGRPLGIAPYGLETLDLLRIEKGHLSVGTEIDGRTTPADLGLARMVSSKKAFVGSSLLLRPKLQPEDRLQLVGLKPADGHSRIPVAAHLCESAWQPDETMTSQGRLTASIESPTLGHPLALALLENGQQRIDEKLWAVSPVEQHSIEVVVTAACFFDPDGKRLHG